MKESPYRQPARSTRRGPGRRARSAAPEELSDQPTLHRIVVEKDGAVVAEMTASANAPTVRVTTPDGGEIFAGGNLTIRESSGRSRTASCGPPW